MTAKKPIPPPLPDWASDAPRPTPPPPPRRTDRPRVIGDVGQAVAIESGLGDLNTAVRKLKQAGLSWDEIELAFFEAMKEEFGK